MLIAILIALCGLATALNDKSPSIADGSKIVFQGSQGPVSLNQCNSACASFNLVLFQTCRNQISDYHQQIRCGCSTSFVAQAQICSSCCEKLGYQTQFQSVSQVVDDCQVIIDRGNTSSAAAEIPHKTLTSVQTVFMSTTMTQWTQYATQTTTATEYATKTDMPFQYCTAQPVYTQSIFTSIMTSLSSCSGSSVPVQHPTTWTSAWFSTPCSATSSTSAIPTTWSRDFPIMSTTNTSSWQANPTIFLSGAQGHATQSNQILAAFGALLLAFAGSCTLL